MMNNLPLYPTPPYLWAPDLPKVYLYFNITVLNVCPVAFEHCLLRYVVE